MLTTQLALSFIFHDLRLATYNLTMSGRGVSVPDKMFDVQDMYGKIGHQLLSVGR